MRHTDTQSSSTWLLAVGGLVVPFVVLLLGYWLSASSKELSYGIIAQSTIVDLTDGPARELEVSLRGEKLQRVESLTVQFENTGSVPIERRDFDGDIVVSFNGADQLAVALAATEPTFLSPSFDVEDEGVAISPLLMNPGDRFVLTFLFSGNVEGPIVSARISGIRRLTALDPPSDKSHQRSLMLRVGAVSAFLIYMYLWGLLGPTLSPPWPNPDLPLVKRVWDNPLLPPIDSVVLILASLGTASLLAASTRWLSAWDLSGWLAVVIIVSLLAGWPPYYLGRKRLRSIASSHIAQDSISS